MNNGNVNVEILNSKLILLTGKLEEMNFADSSTENTELKTKLNELEQILILFLIQILIQILI